MFELKELNIKLHNICAIYLINNMRRYATNKLALKNIRELSFGDIGALLCVSIFSQICIRKIYERKQSTETNFELKFIDTTNEKYICDKQLAHEIQKIQILFNTDKYDIIKKSKINFASRKTILLHGPPGNGKTSFAKYIANTHNKQLANINLASISSCWVGDEPAKIYQICNTIDNLESNENIYFFDEIDSIMSKRSSTSGHISEKDHAKSVNAFLAWIDGVNNNNNLLLFATNNMNALDNAFINRMIFKIKIPPVSKENMMLFWKYHFSHLNDSDINKLSNMHIEHAY